MAKNLVTLATVISIRPLGENNSSVTLLTRSEGIIFATMYGGSKSRLKSLVSPWNTGTAYLSISNQTQYKISDFDVSAYVEEYKNAPEDSRDNTVLGKFIVASLSQKSMVTSKIYRSKNMLAGFSVKYSRFGISGIREYRKLVKESKRQEA